MLKNKIKLKKLWKNKSVYNTIYSVKLQWCDDTDWIREISKFYSDTQVLKLN